MSLDIAALVSPAPDPGVLWRWATVTQASPLRVQLDGDAAALSVTPDSLVAGLTVAARVWVALIPTRDSTGVRLLVTGLAVAALASNPNLFANPIFRVNQRAAVSGASLASGAYFVDRMKSYTATNAVTWTGDNISGRVLTIPTGKSVGSVQERVNFPAGTYTLSWGGTAAGRFYKSGTTAPGFAVSPVTVTADGLADMVAEWGAGTLFWVKIEAGGVATALFLDTIGDELLRCARYYVRSAGAHYSPCTNSGFTSSYAMAVQLSPIMRATPTLSIYSGADQSGTAGSATWFASAAGTVAAAYQEQVSADHFSIVRSGANGYGMALFSYTADAEL